MPAASPTVRGSTAAVAGLSTTSPSATAIGDLVICYTFERLGVGSASTLTTLTGNGFVEIVNHFHNDASTDGALAAAYKIATAAGAQTYTPFSSTVGTETWTGCLVVTVDTYDVTTLPPSAASSQTNNAVPNPPQVTSLTSARFYLGIAISAWHLGSAATVTVTVPSGFDARGDIAGSATAELACATDEFTGVTTIDPGAWGDDVGPNGTASLTIALINDPSTVIEADADADGTTGGQVVGAALALTVADADGAATSAALAATVLPGAAAVTAGATGAAVSAVVEAAVAGATGAATASGEGEDGAPPGDAPSYLLTLGLGDFWRTTDAPMLITGGLLPAEGAAVEADGAAAGSATATATAAAVVTTVVAAEGAATSTATATALATAVGASTASATTTATASALAATIAASAGAATTTATAAATAASVAGAAGEATTAAISGATWAVVASATGVATVLGEVTDIGSGSEAAAVGAATVSGVGSAVWLGTLLSTAAATVTADGETVLAVGGDGAAQGTGLALGVSAPTVGAVFAAAGVGTGTGRGEDAANPIEVGVSRAGVAPFRYSRGRGRPL